MQPTPAKHLTDEELKQQYGIHMTSRIQEDSGGTEAKWADIDDDEEDWAPETIEWTDGTKVTLTHTEHPPLPEQPPQAQKEPLPPGQPPMQDPIKLAAPKPITTSVGPNPTVLRLGANAERQAKAASISSKGTNDRLQSGSTSPAPPPAKSPWAALPPVDRVSPVNPSPHAPPASQHRSYPSHSHREDAYHAPLPPQEIAADDFNRAWRDTPSGAPRELYNSRSGRYEPVVSDRRGSWRADQGPRPPAVLQRTGHGDHAGPAEPSAAFQTHRSSHQDGMGWNRRRTSSNVSGGSGLFARRPSLGRDMPHPRYTEGRRGSHANTEFIDPALGRDTGHFREFSMNHPHSGGPGGHAPPSVSVGSESSPVENQVAPEVPQEDPVALQERIMKEKRLEARQRRLEEEEKERQAKEERIRQKLAALGPAPEKKRKDSIEGRKPQVTTSNTSTTVVSSPPKPPVPEPSGEPKQYGMMKVHHPDSVKKLVAERVSEKQSERTSPHMRRVSSPHQDANKRERDLPPHPPSVKHQQQPDSHRSETKPDEQGGQWRSKLTSFAPWSTAPTLPSTSPSTNDLWKALNTDSPITLGNGIFDPNLTSFSSREFPLRSQLSLDQPAMSAGQSFPGADAPPATQQPPLPSPETRHTSLDALSPIGRPGPIAPPSAHHLTQQDRTTAWNNFGPRANQREAEDAQKFRQEFQKTQKLRQELAASGQHIPQTSLNPSWKKVEVGKDGRRHISSDKEKPSASSASVTQTAADPVIEPSSSQATWKPIRVEDGVRRQVAAHPSTNSNIPPSNPLTGLDAPADGLAFGDNHSRIANVPHRSSRFFPNTTEQTKRMTNEKLDAHRSPSPPPPEELSHPVYSTASDRPLVHLPSPKVVVKLPPKAVPATPAPPPTFASMAAAAPPRVTPPSTATATAISWQEKFNGLFGRKTSTDKKGVLAVASASKEPLDVPLPNVIAAVSLPSNMEVPAQTGDGDLAARQVAEGEEIFEDREPGSQPGVRVPNMAPPAAWHAAAVPQFSHTRRRNMKPMQVYSVEPFWIGSSDRDQHGNTWATIRFPGRENAKTIILPRKAGQHARHRGPSANNRSRKVHKPRDAAAAGSTGTNTSSSRQPRKASASWGPRNTSGSQ